MQTTYKETELKVTLETLVTVYSNGDAYITNQDGDRELLATELFRNTPGRTAEQIFQEDYLDQPHEEIGEDEDGQFVVVRNSDFWEPFNV